MIRQMTGGAESLPDEVGITMHPTMIQRAKAGTVDAVPSSIGRIDAVGIEFRKTSEPDKRNLLDSFATIFRDKR